MASPATRRVRMIAPTYIKGVVADVDTEHTLPSATASEFVGNGRAVYLDPAHTDVLSPPSAELEPVSPHPLIGGAVANPSTTLSLNKGKTYA